MASARRSIDTLQAGRALAALAVVLYHTNITLALPKYLGTDIVPLFDFADCGVQYFFVLSGFVIWLIHARDIGSPGRAPAFLRKRVQRIYPPLWGVLLLLLPASLLLSAGGDELHLWTLASAFLVLPVSHEVLLGTEWTLRHEVLFYLMFALLIWRWRAGAVAMALWLALSAAGGLVRLDFPASFLFSSQHLLFAFGAAACMTWNRGAPRAPGLLLGLGLGQFAATWALLFLLRGCVHHGALTDWSYGMGAALTVLGGAGLEMRGSLRLPRWLLFLGEASYSIYLVHFPVVSALCRVAARLRGAGLDPLLLAAVAVLAAAAGIAFHLWVERPLLGLFQQRPVARLQQS